MHVNILEDSSELWANRVWDSLSSVFLFRKGALLLSPHSLTATTGPAINPLDFYARDSVTNWGCKDTLSTSQTRSVGKRQDVNNNMLSVVKVLMEVSAEEWFSDFPLPRT